MLPRCGLSNTNQRLSPRSFAHGVGASPGAHVLEPLHLTPDLCALPRMSLPILYSLFSVVFLSPSMCVAPKLRSLHFAHPVYVASRYFQ